MVGRPGAGGEGEERRVVEGQRGQGVLLSFHTIMEYSYFLIHLFEVPLTEFSKWRLRFDKTGVKTQSC